MIKKKVLNPRRVRRINGSFAFIEHRFRSWLHHLNPEELLLYFFLALAADDRGLSYYAPETIGERLKLSPEQVQRASFAEWGNIFDSTTVATAIADRLVSRAEVLILGGPSYRKKVKS